MTNGEKIVNIAFLEVGTKEEPKDSNKQKYGEWFGFNEVAWCAIFVSWVYDHAGFTLKDMGWPKGFAGCQAGVAKFKKRKEITADPKPGDIVFFDWNNDGRYDHVGIFKEGIDKNYFFTIEGNTSLTNDSNGGEVMIRKRKYGNCIFVHPSELNV